MANVASGTETLSLPEQAAIKARIERDGAKRTAAALGLSREPLARLAAGLPTRRGTVMQARAALARRHDSQPPAAVG